MTKWSGFYVVGLGRHFLRHLLPAIIENKQTLYAVITRHRTENFRADYKITDSFDCAKNMSYGKTCFLISSAPSQHFPDAMQALELGYDILVEKPAFLSVSEAQAAMDLANKNNCILAEAFMFKYSNIYNHAIAYWNKYKFEISEIEINFSIPELPTNTFRDNKEIKNSILFDLGCYGLTMLFDLNIDLEHLNLRNFEFYKGRLSSLELVNEKKPTVKMNFSAGTEYQNYLKFCRNDHSQILFEPFFYGRKGKKKIILSYGNEVITETALYDGNSFCNMLLTSNECLKRSQIMRFSSMLQVTSCLNRLSHEISKFT